MTKPAILDMTVEELRGAARALRDLAASTVGWDAYAIRQVMERDATMAETMIENAEAEEAEAEAAQEGLADAVAAQRTRARASSPLGAGVWTAARLELLREWPAARPKRALLDRINALPGPPIASVDAMDQKARKLGLVRAALDLPPDAQAQAEARTARLREMGRRRAEEARIKKAAEARTAQPEGAADAPSTIPPADHIADARNMVSPPAPVVPAPAEDGNPHLDVGNEQEAREMLAKGKGARDLEHWFGGSLTWWQAWCERERAQMGRAA